MESAGISSAELVRIVVVGLVLLVGLGLLRWVLKVATRVLALGCLGTLIVVALLVMLAMGA